MADRETWGRESEGGIFGPDIDYEMHEAMFQDVAAAGRARYGEAPRNRHVRALLDARDRRAARAEMLVFQRFIDEIPDALRWIKKSASDRIITTACRALGVDYFEYSSNERMYVTDDFEQAPLTGRVIVDRVVSRAKAVVDRLIHGDQPAQQGPKVSAVAHARMWTDDWSQTLDADDRKADYAEILGEDPGAVQGGGGSILDGEGSFFRGLEFRKPDVTNDEEDRLLLNSVAKKPVEGEES